MSEGLVLRPVRRPAPGPRRRAEEVLAAAALVFSERGFHGASTQDIGDRLGMRQASLYYYFPSKEAALEQVCQRGIEGVIERAMDIFNGEGTATEKLATMIRSHITPIGEKRNFVRAFIHERRFLPKESRRRIGRMARRYEKLVQSVIENGIAKGEIEPGADALLSAKAILSLCNAAADLPGKELTLSSERIADGLSRLLLHGLAPDKPR